MERKRYFVGLFGNNELVCEDNGRFYYYIRRMDEQILLDGNKNEKMMKLLKRRNEEEKDVEFDEEMIERGVTMMLSEDGTRWEGDWYNQEPFGFGCLYDGEGNRIYSGFMFEGKKIGFGEEYFADNHKVDYCGNFVNDKRHGWGTSYDRNNNK